jgi:CBS-domain-containing membrane protein
MTTAPVTASPQDTVETVARLMYLHRVKSLPVVDADSLLVGIVSRADVLPVFSRTAREIHDEVAADVALSMSPPTRSSCPSKTAS